jgi:lipoic acid synthetase
VSKGPPAPLDSGEPARVAEAARRLGLEHVVVTSVTRDDLADGGAGHLAAVVAALREVLAGASVELLVPDFGGDRAALRTVLAAGPEVLNHNVETIPRLYPRVRPQAGYFRSLELLRTAKKISPGAVTKSGLMVGLGESRGEVLEVLRDLAAAGVEAVTIGQYLAPSGVHLPVAGYVRPERFEEYAREARALGIPAASCGPWVRSSYGAAEALSAARVSRVEDACSSK